MLSEETDHSSQAETLFTNRLIGSSSPYLLQHARNPVDWYEWGDEAFAKARAENKPIFLSIGYSSCHWCHVMAHESFENDGIAALLNRHFVSIKVDREERPDVDSIYMTAVQMMTGQGGWPLSVFLTPDLEPFYGGIYFPPDDRWGRPGFSNLLLRITELWHGDHDNLMGSAQRITEAMKQQSQQGTISSSPVNQSLVDHALAVLRENYDARWGGFSEAPKFPSCAALMMLMSEYQRTQSVDLLRMVETTLKQMAYGGLYDQVAGGFHRYSTDRQWLVPHFEKMLYDNAQLIRVYLKAYEITANEEYRRIAEETLAYIERDMMSSGGAFYSAQDADTSEGEGLYYVWSYDEFIALAGQESAPLLARYFGVTPGGNFEHRNILHRALSPVDFARKENVEPTQWQQMIEALRRNLLAARSQREAPATDTKILAGWNGLMIAAFVDAYQVLEKKQYLNTALRAAEFVRTQLVVDGQLMRVYSAGVSRIPAYLDDYGLVIMAFVRMAEASGDLRWLETADELAQVLLQRFSGEDGVLFYTDGLDKHVIVREQSRFDGVIPSGNSAAVAALLALSAWTGNQNYAKRAQLLVEQAVSFMTRAPRSSFNMLGDGAWSVLNPPAEIVIVESGSDELGERMEDKAKGIRKNNRLLRFNRAHFDNNRILERYPYLSGRKTVDGKTTAYVCLNYHCLSPVNDPEKLEEQLRDL